MSVVRSRGPVEVRKLVYKPSGFSSGDDLPEPSTLGYFGVGAHSHAVWSVEPPAWVASYEVELYFWNGSSAVQVTTPSEASGVLVGNSVAFAQATGGRPVALRLINVVEASVGSDPFVVRRLQEDRF